MSETLRQTLIGLLMVVITAAWLYSIARRRYKCPYCGRVVRWRDVNCPHCGDDMKMRHRVGPPPRQGRFTIFRGPK